MKMSNDDVRANFAERTAIRAQLWAVKEWLQRQEREVTRCLDQCISDDIAIAELVLGPSTAAVGTERENIALAALELIAQEESR